MNRRSGVRILRRSPPYETYGHADRTFLRVLLFITGFGVILAAVAVAVASVR